jgi:hypothetical protein
VEVDIYEPDFDVPFVGDNLSLEEVLDVLERFARHSAGPPSH